MEPCKRAKESVAKLELPLNKVAEVAWRFVTQPNPVIVEQPRQYHGEEYQERYHGKWNDDCKDYTLVYARPLVYRSYHGTVMTPALVGQKVKTSFC